MSVPAELARLRARLAALYSRTPRLVTEVEQKHANMERLLVLAGVDDENPLWNAVLSYADEHARNELTMALAPALRDGDRQFATGRAASAEDFALALRDLRVAAQRRIAAQKQ